MNINNHLMEFLECEIINITVIFFQKKMSVVKLA